MEEYQDFHVRGLKNFKAEPQGHLRAEKNATHRHVLELWPWHNLGNTSLYYFFIYAMFLWNVFVKIAKLHVLNDQHSKKNM